MSYSKRVQSLEASGDVTGQRASVLRKAWHRAFQPLSRWWVIKGLKALLRGRLFQPSFAALSLGVHRDLRIFLNGWD